MSLRDDDDNEVRPGEAGEICVRAPHAMEQYWKRPEQTAETFKGGTIHLMKGFDPERFLATIAREKINLTLMVPTMIYVALDHPSLDKTDLSSLELILYGASPMSPTRLVEGLQRIGPIFSQLYGQTECYPVSVLRKEDHDAWRPELFASCGFPIT